MHGTVARRIACDGRPYAGCGAMRPASGNLPWQPMLIRRPRAGLCSSSRHGRPGLAQFAMGGSRERESKPSGQPRLPAEPLPRRWLAGPLPLRERLALHRLRRPRIIPTRRKRLTYRVQHVANELDLSLMQLALNSSDLLVKLLPFERVRHGSPDHRRCLVGAAKNLPRGVLRCFAKTKRSWRTRVRASEQSFVLARAHHAPEDALSQTLNQRMALDVRQVPQAPRVLWLVPL